MPNYYNPYYQPQNYYQPPMVQNQSQQIQDGGLVPVPNEEFARNYPVAFGKSVTFKDENAPYIYNKTMGFSQLESPKFEKYKLVKEPTEPLNPGVEDKAYDDRGIINNIHNIQKEINTIWSEIEGIKNDNKSKSKSNTSTERNKNGDD